MWCEYYLFVHEESSSVTVSREILSTGRKGISQDQASDQKDWKKVLWTSVAHTQDIRTVLMYETGAQSWLKMEKYLDSVKMSFKEPYYVPLTGSYSFHNLFWYISFLSLSFFFFLLISWSLSCYYPIYFGFFFPSVLFIACLCPECDITWIPINSYPKLW